MGSGAAGVQRIDGDDLRWPRRGTATWAAMQGVRGLVAWWRGRGGRGGASGLVGGAREARRPWLRRAALSGAFGDEREGEQRRRRGSREREAVEGGRGRLRGVARGSGRLPRRSRRWPASARVRPARSCFVRWHGKKTGEGGQVGWAAGGAGPGR